MDHLRSLGMGALDNMDSSMIKMPRLKLVQNSSKKGTPGKWISNINDEEVDSITGAILAISQYRVMFPKLGEGEKPLCRSNDGIKKSSVDGIGDNNCSRCRFSQWGRSADGKSIKPVCMQGYALLMLQETSPDVWSPAIVSVKGSAIKPAKAFFTEMRARNIPSFAYLTTLSAKAEVTALGRFYQTIFTMSEELLPLPVIEGIALTAQQYSDFVGSDIADVENDHDQPSNSYTAGSGAPAYKLDDNEDLPF